VQQKLIWEQMPTGFRSTIDEKFVAEFNGLDATDWSEFSVSSAGESVIRYTNTSLQVRENPLQALFVPPEKKAGYAIVSLLHRFLVGRAKNVKIKAAMQALQSLA
jgi:hypothetical protein